MPLDSAPPIIPTLSKAKISRQLSYPIGAEQVSAALAAVAQFPLLKLHFWWGIGNQLQWREFEFLRVEYLNASTSGQKWPITTLYQRPPQYRWEIVVQPVPRAMKHRVKQHILETALPQIAEWLNQRSQLAQQGNDILAFFYKKETDEFTSHRLTHLEPLRG